MMGQMPYYLLVTVGLEEKNKKQTNKKPKKKKPSTKKKGQKALENIAKRADAVPLLLFLLFAA